MKPYLIHQNVRSRGATAENPQAQPGAGGQALGGRKGAPAIASIQPGQVKTLLDTDGPGIIRHIWITVFPDRPKQMRNSIIRMFWENNDFPSVEVPLGDFFGIAHGRQVPFESELVSMLNGKGLNCWIPMPFRQHARITLTNDGDDEIPFLFYQVDFTLDDELTAAAGYLHVCFRRENPITLGDDFTILEQVTGSGVFLGTVIGVRDRNPVGWWGEGEVKFYLDGDTQYPTICGTGTEDYVGAAWGLEPFFSRHMGAPFVEQPYYSFYRWHIFDPIYFHESIRITIQDMGIIAVEAADSLGIPEANIYPAFGGGPHRYYDREDDLSAAAFWYMNQPTRLPSVLPDKRVRSTDLDHSSE